MRQKVIPKLSQFLFVVAISLKVLWGVALLTTHFAGVV